MSQWGETKKINEHMDLISRQEQTDPESLFSGSLIQGYQWGAGGAGCQDLFDLTDQWETHG